MPLTWRGVLVLVGVGVLLAVIALLAYPSYISIKTPIHETYMLFALYGYTFLVLTALTLPFLKELVHTFGKPFLTIHHSFAVLGLSFITLHPILNAIEMADPTVFIPDFSSWIAFWAYGGRIALILIYTALVAALLRKRSVHYWKPFHMLVYAALTFAIIHANIIGSSFYTNPVIIGIFSGLYACAMGVFVFKRYQNYKLKGKMRNNH